MNDVDVESANLYAFPKKEFVEITFDLKARFEFKDSHLKVLDITERIKNL